MQHNISQKSMNFYFLVSIFMGFSTAYPTNIRAGLNSDLII